MISDAGVYGMRDTITSNAGANMDASFLVTLGLLIVSKCPLSGFEKENAFLVFLTTTSSLFYI
jgi:hypothetical protein